MGNLLERSSYDTSKDKIEQVLTSIQNYIIEGGIESGTEMPSEKEMAAKLNVNRFILREALRVAQFQGLVDISRGSRTKVAEISVKSVVETMDILLRRSPHILLDLTEAREGLECSIVELAAIRADSETIDRMKKTISTMENNLSDTDICIQMDIDFHNLIVEASNNQVFEIIITSVSNFLKISRERTFKAYGPEISIKAHKAILNAILERNPEKAGKCMEEHLITTKKQLIKLGF